MIGRLFGYRGRVSGIPDEAWSALSSALTPLARYPVPDRERLRRLAGRFLTDKTVEGAGGLEVTPPMQWFIATQACIPILNLGLDLYRAWYAVVVYPGEFHVPFETVDEAGVVHKSTRSLVGESWDRGPVILSWEHTLEGAGDPWGGSNVVIHEFAHKLDQLNGSANGMPPLHRDMNRKRWTEVFTAAFEDFNMRLDAGVALPCDAYAGESPGEFFAVLSETFFMQPQAIRAFYPEVFVLLSAYYRQDPVALAAGE
ncbi:MAG: zinc-dependent peptidase [Gammaproteobacteria bacterium]|jgi:hypothetical protein|nr:zinc-dependent peptidase [Gammaproteobacteria bacterium]